MMRMNFYRLMVLGLLLVGATTFATDHRKMDHSKMDHGGRKMLSLENKKNVVAVLEANELLHEAFFNYDGKEVEGAAVKLSSAMNKIKNSEIKKSLKFSIGKVAEIKASEDRKENDQRYHLISMALIHIVNTYDVGKKYNAYSCPMVKKKWVQNSKKMAKVNNPYAPNMPHCGSQDTHH